MIPKIAHFHWSQNGPGMSWLRWASLRSFKKFHPDWEIRLHPTLPHIAGLGLGYAQEADWTWWEILAEHGGWQVATDVVFVRRIPDDWLDCDLNACRNGEVGVFQFAALGASPGNPYIKACASKCLAIHARGETGSYQVFGVELLKDLGRIMLDQGGKLFDQPMSAFCHIDSNHFGRLWAREWLDLPEDAIGSHWYGGGEQSKELEPLAGPESGHFITDLAMSVVGP